MLSFARIGHVKHIAQLGLIAGGIHQRDALGAAADIAAHLGIPEVVLRTGGRVRALSVDHELFMIGILVQTGSGFKEIRPFVMAVGDSPGGIIRQLKIGCYGCLRHLITVLSKYLAPSSERQIPHPSFAGACT